MSHKFDFTEIIERRGTDSMKWDATERIYKDYLGKRDPKDVICMWIADMDFYPPREIAEAVEKRAAHHIYGYTYEPLDLPEIVAKWVNKHYHIDVEPEEYSYTPGIVPAIGVALRAYCQEGDGVIILSPVYGPFSKTIKQNNMTLQSVELKHEQDGWEIDFEALEAAVNEKTKVLLFCSPHNPIGRVWRKDELEKIRDFVIKHDLLLISDEIHADFIYSGHEHFSPVRMPELRDRTITCFAPSKTFSVAGLMASAIIIRNPELREKFRAERDKSGLHGNMFGYLAMRAAWLHGEPWMREMMEVLEQNRDYLFEKINELNEYGVALTRPESTFLAFIDFREFMQKTGMTEQAELMRFILEDAGIAMNPGTDFGPEGKGYARMNFGCPLSRIEEAVERLAKAVKAKLA
ncbi:MAG: MalY/PatB family protein [Eubacteriales bacterium]|nr:MalY/PatB family protein [Eubacteriales bacterium]